MNFNLLKLIYFFKGKNPPTDQTIKIRSLYKVPNSIFISMSIIAVAGIIVAIGFLCFNIKFREHRYVALANNLI